MTQRAVHRWPEDKAGKPIRPRGKARAMRLGLKGRRKWGRCGSERPRLIGSGGQTPEGDISS